MGLRIRSIGRNQETIYLQRSGSVFVVLVSSGVDPPICVVSRWVKRKGSAQSRQTIEREQCDAGCYDCMSRNHLKLGLLLGMAGDGYPRASKAPTLQLRAANRGPGARSPTERKP